MRPLSKLEAKVWAAAQDGLTLQQMADKFHRSVPSMHDAVRRAKRKLGLAPPRRDHDRVIEVETRVVEPWNPVRDPKPDWLIRGHKR